MQMLHLFCLKRTNFFVWNILSVLNIHVERQQSVTNKLRKPLGDTVVFHNENLYSEETLFLIVFMDFFWLVFKNVNLKCFSFSYMPLFSWKRTQSK